MQTCILKKRKKKQTAHFVGLTNVGNQACKFSYQKVLYSHSTSSNLYNIGILVEKDTRYVDCIYGLFGAYMVKKFRNNFKLV